MCSANSISKKKLLIKNRFGTISDIGDLEIENNSINNELTNKFKTKKEKNRPIVYSVKYHNIVQKLLHDLKIEHFSLRYMSIGIRTKHFNGKRIRLVEK